MPFGTRFNKVFLSTDNQFAAAVCPHTGHMQFEIQNSGASSLQWPPQRPCGTVSRPLTREPPSCRSGRRSTRIWAAAGTPAGCSAQMTRQRSRRAEPQIHWCPTIATVQLSACRNFHNSEGPPLHNTQQSLQEYGPMRRLLQSCMTGRIRWSHSQ